MIHKTAGILPKNRAAVKAMPSAPKMKPEVMIRQTDNGYLARMTNHSGDSKEAHEPSLKRLIKNHVMPHMAAPSDQACAEEEAETD